MGIEQMRIKEWYSRSSSSRTAGVIRLGESSRYDIITQQGWAAFWKNKIKKKKKKKSNYNDDDEYDTTTTTTTTLSSSYSYDPTTYSNNFDQGMGWAEPDNLSRSFSARFAHPRAASHI